MVIGNGMIAGRFMDYRDRDDHLIFASGVSDSSHITTVAMERETQLLTHAIHHHAEKKFVYFSTCSIYDPGMQDGQYVKHKKDMEALILANHPRYLIFRFSNPIGNTSNNHTFFNFFIDHIVSKTPFEAWKNASRNIIDIDDAYLLCNDILQNGTVLNTIINIASPRNYTVPGIIGIIEDHFDIKSNCRWVDKGDGPEIDTSSIEDLIRKFNIKFDENYLHGLLKKYFPV